MRIRKILENAPTTPVWLESDKLEHLQKKYPYPSEYGYDPDTVKRRGNERSKEILSLIRRKIQKKDSIHSFLELGCWDGMVSCALHRKGYKVIGIDNQIEGFDERAISEGVNLIQMDAAQLLFKDEDFDFVFSYDAFEHFNEPEMVLEEMLRVTKTGGYMYLSFGPLYMSPMGLHAYRSVSVPYCQFLFPNTLLQDFVRLNGLEEIDFNQVNGWSLMNYHQLWRKYSNRLKTILYYERPNVSHLDLIKKYSSCFKSKTDSLDNLTISIIEVLFQKIR